MRLSSLVSNHRRLAIDVDGETLNVTVIPSRLTPAAQEEFNRLRVDAGDGIAMISMINRVIVSWDLEGESGPYPLDIESLGDLPIPFVVAVFNAMMADIVPNAKRPEASKGGSLRAD